MSDRRIFKLELLQTNQINSGSCKRAMNLVSMLPSLSRIKVTGNVQAVTPLKEFARKISQMSEEDSNEESII